MVRPQLFGKYIAHILSLHRLYIANSQNNRAVCKDNSLNLNLNKQAKKPQWQQSPANVPLILYRSLIDA